MTPPILAVLEEVLTRAAQCPTVECAEAEDLDVALITPRFATSQNVVVVLVARQTGRPIVIAKMPRLRGAGSPILHEARILRSLQAVQPGGYSTIPRVLAVEQWAGRPVLVQTALVGTLIDGGEVRRSGAACIEDVLEWLYELPTTPARGQEQHPQLYDQLVREPLITLSDRFRRHGQDTAVIEHTLDLLEPLRTARLPLVFEHGDLNYPNILRLDEGGVGVIDWELGEERSFPGRDIIFFLAFVAFARSRARSRGQELAALDDAYLARDAWARRIVGRYADRLGIDRSLLTPLFVACWARHATSWLVRLGDAGTEQTRAAVPRGAGPGEEAAVEYIQGNLSFAFWNEIVVHVDALRWD